MRVACGWEARSVLYPMGYIPAYIVQFWGGSIPGTGWALSNEGIPVGHNLLNLPKMLQNEPTCIEDMCCIQWYPSDTLHIVMPGDGNGIDYPSYRGRTASSALAGSSIA